MKKIGYARVSTPEQRHDRQILGLRELCDELHLETFSARTIKRPVYEAVLAKLGSGDMLVVWDLDRAFRSVVDAITEADKLLARGVQFQIVTLNIDTTTPEGRFVYTIQSAVAELERRRTSRRTKEGLAAARARGSRIGRPPTMSADEVRDARARVAVGQSRSAVAREMGVPRWTLSRAIGREDASQALPQA
ncbi:MAG: recombinase family protein [Methylorubrum rhodinum]|uniref:recombinase family protein n=1 Tax=Methylorubrum rhodinum TaxID=29428 RepID=UPI003BAE8BB2